MNKWKAVPTKSMLQYDFSAEIKKENERFTLNIKEYGETIYEWDFKDLDTAKRQARVEIGMPDDEKMRWKEGENK